MSPSTSHCRWYRCDCRVPPGLRFPGSDRAQDGRRSGRRSRGHAGQARQGRLLRGRREARTRAAVPGHDVAAAVRRDQRGSLPQRVVVPSDLIVCRPPVRRFRCQACSWLVHRRVVLERGAVDADVGRRTAASSHRGQRRDEAGGELGRVAGGDEGTVPVDCGVPGGRR